MWVVNYFPDKEYHQASIKEVKRFHAKNRQFGIVYPDYVSYHETKLGAIDALNNFKELCDKRIKELTTE